jgi:gas vesicle protein
MENSKSTVNVVGALALGVLAGTAIGLLFAPNKGSETRERIAGNAKRMADDLKRKVTNGANAFQDKADDLEKRAQDKLLNFKNGFEAKAKELEQI